MSTTISMDILARDRASRTLDHIGDKADRSAQRWATMGRVAKNAGIMVGAGLAVAATAAVKLTKAAMEDQQAAVQLATAYRNNADAKKGEIAASEQWITAQGRALGIADDELRPALAQLVTATHDVGEAQEQASLAMDIAAGRNVALATVTKALEKAQNGSLLGLSKLGVKTKNAAGDTLSLDKITRKLADTYKGQAAKAAETAEGKFGRLRLTLTETGESIGYKLLPYAENLTDWILNDGVPMAEKLWRAWENNGIDGVVSKIEKLTDTQGELKPIVDDVRKALGSAAAIITGSLIPAVADITRALPPFMSPLGLVADTLGFMADHADLTKYAIIGLTGVLTANRGAALLAQVASSGLVTSLTAQGTAAERAATRTRLLGSALRGAAGIGGMLALAQGAQEANQKLSALETVAGGAALGFSMGGPWGAAVGTLGGVAKATNDVMKKQEAAARAAEYLGTSFAGVRQDAANYRDTLDQLTGATTRQTRAAVVQRAQEEGVLALANRLHVSNRDLVGTILGQEGATRRLNRATREYSGSLEGNEQAKWNEWVRKNAHDFAVQADATDEARNAMKSWRQALKGVPKDVRTRVMQIGTDITMKQIRHLERKYGDLTKKQVRTIISAVGTETTIRKVKGVWTVMKDGEKIRPNLNNWLAEYAGAMVDSKRKASRGVADLNELLGGGTRKAKPDLKPFLSSLSSSLFTAKTQADSGGRNVGANLKAGVLLGSAGLGPLLGAQMASAIRQALAEMRREAQQKSPSRKTYVIGRMLAKGAENGMRDGKTKLGAAAADMMASIIKGIRKGEVPMRRVLDAVTNQVQRTLDRVKRLKDARAATVSDFKGFATSLFAAQAPESGGFTVDSLLAFQAAERDKAQSVQAAVRKLTNMGLSGSLIKQMQAGGSGGIEQLLALSQGNQAQISLANSLNAQTQAAYGATGMGVANTMQGAEEREARRDARLAKQIAAAVHEAIQDREAKYEFVLRGNTLVAILKKERHDNPAGSANP